MQANDFSMFHLIWINVNFKEFKIQFIFLVQNLISVILIYYSLVLIDYFNYLGVLFHYYLNYLILYILLIDL